jgi:hypothetical protein
MPADSHVELMRRFIERWNADGHDGMIARVEFSQEPDHAFDARGR